MMKDKVFVENILCPYFDFLTNFLIELKCPAQIVLVPN